MAAGKPSRAYSELRRAHANSSAAAVSMDTASTYSRPSRSYDINGVLTEEEALQKAMEESRSAAQTNTVSPLVSVPLALTEVANEYASGNRADLWRAKTRHLARKYQSIQRVRGDGNCFYRAFIVSFLERLLIMRPDERSPICNRLVPVSRQFVACLPAHLGEKLESHAADFAQSLLRLCEAGAPNDGTGVGEGLRELASDDASILWLRLLASAYMRAHRETFEPVCSDDRRDFGAFLAAEVEAMGVEADEMQIQALTAALQLRVRVEYLDAEATLWSERCGPHRFLVCGPKRTPSVPLQGAPADPPAAMAAAAAAATNDDPPSAPLVACLLFRPGHYDVLSPRAWDQMDGEDEPRAAFVPPLSPTDPDAAVRKPSAPDDRCHRCRTHDGLQGCWLCGQWVCGFRQCARFGHPNGVDVEASARPTQNSVAQTLNHTLPQRFGVRHAMQQGAVCARCLALCPPAAEMLITHGAALYADAFTLLQCICGKLDFPDEMLAHMDRCRFIEERRRAMQEAREAAEPPPPPARHGGGGVDATPVVAASIMTDDDLVRDDWAIVEGEHALRPDDDVPPPNPHPPVAAPTDEFAGSSSSAAPVAPTSVQPEPTSSSLSSSSMDTGGMRSLAVSPRNQPRRPGDPPQATTCGACESTAAPASAAVADADKVSTLDAMIPGLGRENIVAALTMAEGDMDLAASTLLATKEDEAAERRRKMADQDYEANLRRYREQARQQAEKQEEANVRARWEAQRAAAQTQRLRQRQRELEEAQRQHAESEQRLALARSAAAATTSFSPIAAGVAAVRRTNDAELYEAASQRIQAQSASKKRAVDDLYFHREYFMSELQRIYGVSHYRANEAVHAAIKTQGDFQDATDFLFEPAEVEAVLRGRATHARYGPCRDCQRYFLTYDGWQQHSDWRRSKGRCRNVANGQTSGGIVGAATDVLSNTMQGITQGVSGMFSGEAESESRLRWF